MIKIYDGRTEFYQWDLDQKFIVTDPDITEVHYFNHTTECAPICEVYEEDGKRVVNIPNFLFQRAINIRAYLYNGCCTKGYEEFVVQRKPKPDDYVYTETEVKRWEDFEKRLDELELGSRAIIDVDTLPEEDINTALLYRTAEGVYWYDREWHKVPDEDEILNLLVTPDFNENDPESKSYIANRPFYDTRETDENGEEIGELKTIDDVYLDLENRAKMKEVESIAKGAGQARSYGDYATMVEALNSLPNDVYKIGQSIMIVTLNVPDLWVSAIAEESVPYTYVDDTTLAEAIKTNGSVQVGYYVLSALETQKVDLTDYVKNTDIAGNVVAGEKAGVVGLNYASASGLQLAWSGNKRFLRISVPDTNAITRRNGMYALCIGDLDTYIKYGITGRKTINNVESVGNQIALTDEEKASAAKWLGVPNVSNRSFILNTTYSGESVNLVNGKAYLQTIVTRSVDDLIGATVTYRNGSSIAETSTLTTANKFSWTTDGVTFKIGYATYIFVVYNTNYKPTQIGSNTFPKAGIYFSYYDDGDPNEVVSLSAEITKIDNNYIDLTSHTTIKELLARIEALEKN